MAAYDDMREELEYVASLRAELEREYANARTNPDLKSVLRPRVGSALVHLRAALDYSAKALFKRHCAGAGKRHRVYFPYSPNLSTFNRMLDLNLPTLRTVCPDAVKAIRSMQLFECGDSWLIDLCNQTNAAKHEGPAPLTRENSPRSAISISNVVRFSDASGTIGKLTVNGQRLNPNGPIVVRANESVEGVQNQLIESWRDKVRQEFEWVKFNFPGTAGDTLELIGKAHGNITAYAEAVKSYL